MNLDILRVARNRDTGHSPDALRSDNRFEAGGAMFLQLLQKMRGAASAPLRSLAKSGWDNATAEERNLGVRPTLSPAPTTWLFPLLSLVRAPSPENDGLQLGPVYATLRIGNRPSLGPRFFDATSPYFHAALIVCSVTPPNAGGGVTRGMLNRAELAECFDESRAALWRSLSPDVVVPRCEDLAFSDSHEINLPQLAERAMLLFGSARPPAERGKSVPPDVRLFAGVHSSFVYSVIALLWSTASGSQSWCAFAMSSNSVDRSGDIVDHSKTVEPELLSLLGRLRLRAITR